MLEVVRQKYHALPSSAQQEINESVSVRKMFVEEVSKELDISPDEIIGYLSVVIAATNQDLDALLNMVSIGEKAGRLEEMLANVSKTIDTDLTTRLGGLSRLIQPILLLVMGGLIAFVMGAVLIPIFELNSLAGGL